MDLRQKFQIRNGMVGTVIGKPDDRKLDGIESLEECIERDYVFVFVRNIEEVNSLCVPALSNLKKDGLVWFCYPKKSSKLFMDLTRDVGWESIIALGYRGVRAVAIDETWTGIRFRNQALVGS
jgi:hypothetical protein